MVSGRALLRIKRGGFFWNIRQLYMELGRTPFFFGGGFYEETALGARSLFFLGDGLRSFQRSREKKKKTGKINVFFFFFFFFWIGFLPITILSFKIALHNNNNVLCALIGDSEIWSDKGGGEAQTTTKGWKWWFAAWFPQAKKKKNLFLDCHATHIYIQYIQKKQLEVVIKVFFLLIKKKKKKKIKIRKKIFFLLKKKKKKKKIYYYRARGWTFKGHTICQLVRACSPYVKFTTTWEVGGGKGFVCGCRCRFLGEGWIRSLVGIFFSTIGLF